MNKSKPVLSHVVALFAALFATSTFAMPPNLWWDHVEPGLSSQSECMEKADTVLRRETAASMAVKPENFEGDDRMILFHNDTTRAVIECMQMGDRQLVLIMTTSNELEFGNKLYEALKKGMSAK